MASTLAIMETYDAFTFRNRRIQAWLVLLVVAAGGVAAATSPAFWLCIVGMLLIASGVTANSVRTGQWYTWQRADRSVSWFEGWAILSGAVLIATPLVEVLARSYFGL